MITAFDRIVIDVPDLSIARAQYQQLLGAIDDQDILHLGNADIQLRQSTGAAKAQITGLKLLDTALEKNTERALNPGPRDITLARSNFRPPGFSAAPTANGIYAVDHLVLQSRDADDCIRLFANDLGMRLALDQDVPSGAGACCFFAWEK